MSRPNITKKAEPVAAVYMMNKAFHDMSKDKYSSPVSEAVLYAPESPLATSGGSAGWGNLNDFDSGSSYGGGAGHIDIEPFG